MRNYLTDYEIAALEMELDDLVNKYGFYYGTSTTTINLPCDIYDKVCKIGEKINKLKEERIS